MSAADYFRGIADRCRSIPADFGLREHSAEFVKRANAGGFGVGQVDEVSTPILVNGANPKVRFPSQKEIALGYMSMGDCTLGPFTPAFGDGGVDRELLKGDPNALGQLYLVRITGPQCPDGILYTIVNANLDRALRVTLTLRPQGNQ